MVHLSVPVELSNGAQAVRVAGMGCPIPARPDGLEPDHCAELEHTADDDRLRHHVGGRAVVHDAVAGAYGIDRRHVEQS